MVGGLRAEGTVLRAVPGFDVGDAAEIHLGATASFADAIGGITEH